jgi:cytidine deaminase
LSASDRGKPSGRGPVSDRRRRGDRRSGAERRSAAERRAGSVPVESDRRERPDRRAADRRIGGERRAEAEWQPVPLEMTREPGFESEGGLVAAAADARLRAHARYSNFLVGAALETADGAIVTGCNIENATYGLTLCAERVALVKALSDGYVVFTRIAVVADTESPTPPCGACRQLLWEYCGDIDVIIANLSGAAARFRLSALLPRPFDGRLLE